MDTLTWISLIIVAIMLIATLVRSIFYSPIKPQPPHSDDLGGGGDSGGPWDSGSHHGGGHDGGHGGGDGEH